MPTGVLEFDADLFGPLWYGAGLAEKRNGDERLTAPPPLLQYLPGVEEPADPGAAWEEAKDEARRLGLIDRAGATPPDVTETMHLLAHAHVEADTRFAPDLGQHVRGLLSLSGDQAVRTRVEGRHVRIDPVWASSGYSSLVGLWPELTPAPGKTVSLRLADAEAASKAAAQAQQGHDQVEATARELRSRGVRGDDARNYTRMTSGQRVHDGEFSVAVRDRLGKRHKPDTVVLVTGTTQGSFAQYTRGEFLVTAPADPGLVARTLSETAEDLRRRSA